MANSEMVLGYAVNQLGAAAKARRDIGPQIRDLDRASEKPKKFGEDYSNDVKQTYSNLLTEAETDHTTPDQARDALGELMEWASQKDRQPIDLADQNSRKLFSKALLGLQSLRGLISTESQVLSTDPNMIGPRQRELSYANSLYEIRQKLGLDKDYDSNYLMSLIGTVAAINPDDVNSIAFLTRRESATFNGRLKDEHIIALKAFEGGRESSVHSAINALSDISHMGLKDYEGLLARLKPQEMFFLAHLPFTVKENATGINRSITIAEVFDFLMTDEGKKFFRMPPYLQSTKGLERYMNKFLAERYPNAAGGLSILPDYSVATDQTPGWKKAGVLDAGNRDLSGLSNPYVRMGENTWLNLYNMAVGYANVMVGRQVLYRGNVNLIGKDLQKAANSLPFYFDSYTMWDEWQRNTFPRFGGLAERMAPHNPMNCLLPLEVWPDKMPEDERKKYENWKKFDVDVAKPYEPRDWHERAGGVEINYNGLSDNEKVGLQLFLADLFYAPEEGPGDGLIEQAVEELYRGKNGKYYDEAGVKHDCPRLNDAQLIDLAWEWDKKIRDSLLHQTHTEDKKLETLVKYRTFYPLPPEVSRAKIQNITKNTHKEWLNRVNFEGLIKRLGGAVRQGDSYTGVDGALKVIDSMGCGWWCRPTWGTQPGNAPEKHGGYETRMVEIYDLIQKMSAAGVQAKTDDLQESIGLSARGRQDFDELTVKGLDRAFSRIRGVQSDVHLREASIKEFLEAYGKAVTSAGFMTENKGAWWIYKYACEVAKNMCGLPSSLQYLSAERSYYRDEGGEKQSKPVVYGDAVAKYESFYEQTPKEALAVLGIYIDGKEPVYPARAGRISPIAVEKTGNNLVPVRINTNNWYGHQRQIPFGTPQKAYETIATALWEVIIDNKIQSDDRVSYFMR